MINIAIYKIFHMFERKNQSKIKRIDIDNGLRVLYDIEKDKCIITLKP